MDSAATTSGTTSPESSTATSQASQAKPATAPVSAKAGRESLQARQRRLEVARRRATMFLAAVTVVFVAVTVAGAHGTLLGFVQAGAEAAMVGGVADWFAVTALFRKPFGLPIPHTALIVERKDQFAATLGQFVQENFLNADVLTDRIRAAGIASRAAAWLSGGGGLAGTNSESGGPGQSGATSIAGHAANLVVTLAEALRDEDAQRMLTAELTRAASDVQVAPLLGRTLRVLIAEGHHEEVFGIAITAADRYLEDHRGELRDRFESEAPRWMPDMVYDRVFDRLHTSLRNRLTAMAADPEDEARRQFEDWIAALPDRLENSPELRERGEQIKRDVLGSPVVRDWTASVWTKIKETLKAQAADPDSELRRRMAGALEAAGRRLATDTKLADSLERAVESGARALADQFHDELAGLVTGTIQRWDASETSFQLELLLGRDLQFIRINGTVVGAGVGLILHALTFVLG